MQNKTNVFVWVGILIAMVIAIGGYFFPQVQAAFGGFGTRFPNGLCVGSSCSVTQNKLTIGNSGTPVGNYIYGTCYLKADFSISASSTGMVDCVDSAFQAGDYVQIFGYATSSTALTRQYALQGVGTASSTNGFAPVRLTNWTTLAAVPAATNGLGSSTPYLIIRP